MPIISNPCFCTSSRTSTERPAAGPLTCSGEPARNPTTIPPTIPVMMPAVGGMPDAIEMPMQSGSATRKTTTEASRSRPQVEVVAAVVVSADVMVSRAAARGAGLRAPFDAQ